MPLSTRDVRLSVAGEARDSDRDAAARGQARSAGGDWTGGGRAMAVSQPGAVPREGRTDRVPGGAVARALPGGRLPDQLAQNQSDAGRADGHGPRSALARIP